MTTITYTPEQRRLIAEAIRDARRSCRHPQAPDLERLAAARDPEGRYHGLQGRFAYPLIDAEVEDGRFLPVVVNGRVYRQVHDEAPTRVLHLAYLNRHGRWTATWLRSRVCRELTDPDASWEDVGFQAIR